MTSAPSPLATPLAWDLVAQGYDEEAYAQFAKYAADALALAQLRPGECALDVAAGSGALSVQAAQVAGRVHALDFSCEMLTRLRDRAARLGIHNIEAREGDGQALPYADESFDCAFSMFGLIFFPDRLRGMRELLRVLKPGGRALISSWQPTSRVPLLMAAFEALSAELPNLPFGDGKGPLSDPDDIRSELNQAGFFDVQTVECVHAVESESIDAFWRKMRRSLAPLVLLEHRMGAEAFGPVAENIERRLKARHQGPVHAAYPAWLTLARKAE